MTEGEEGRGGHRNEPAALKKPGAATPKPANDSSIEPSSGDVNIPTEL
jgi:hypothetical protein